MSTTKFVELEKNDLTTQNVSLSSSSTASYTISEEQTPSPINLTSSLTDNLQKNVEENEVVKIFWQFCSIFLHHQIVEFFALTISRNLFLLLLQLKLDICWILLKTQLCLMMNWICIKPIKLKWPQLYSLRSNLIWVQPQQAKI